MKDEVDLKIKDCFELEGDYQNQFLGQEVFPQPRYKRIKLSERSVNKVHYEDVYILEPLHYYRINFENEEEIKKNDTNQWSLSVISPCFSNGLIISPFVDGYMYLFNGSQNIIYLQKGTKIGRLIKNKR